MKVNIEIGVEQLLKVVKQLPIKQLNRLKCELNRLDESSVIRKKTSFERMLLNGPQISDSDLDDFEQIRFRLQAWRTK